MAPAGLGIGGFLRIAMTGRAGTTGGAAEFRMRSRKWKVVLLASWSAERSYISST
jgi:hypothetical protein